MRIGKVHCESPADEVSGEIGRHGGPDGDGRGVRRRRRQSRAPPAPPSGPYSVASLNGTYAFVLSGQDGGGFFTRAGSFTANGAGSITGGVQDLNSGIVPGSVTVAITGGSYTIDTNGKGTLSLIDSAETIQFSVVLTSTNAGLITQTDGSATASGNFTAQDTSAFAGFPNNIAGPYVFDYSGVDPNGFGESIVGQMVVEWRRRFERRRCGHQRRFHAERGIVDYWWSFRR